MITKWEVLHCRVKILHLSSAVGNWKGWTLFSVYAINSTLSIAALYSSFKNMFKCGKKKTAREEASSQVIQEEYKKLGAIRYFKL